SSSARNPARTSTWSSASSTLIASPGGVPPETRMVSSSREESGSSRSLSWRGRAVRRGGAAAGFLGQGEARPHAEPAARSWARVERAAEGRDPFPHAADAAAARMVVQEGHPLAVVLDPHHDVVLTV